MDKPRRFKTISIVVVTERSGQMQQEILREVMGVLSKLTEEKSHPIDSSIEPEFVDAELSTRASSIVNNTITENRGKTPAEVLDHEEFEREDSGNVKTKLRDHSLLEMLVEIWNRCSKFVTSLIHKGYRIAIRKISDDGDHLKNKFQK